MGLDLVELVIDVEQSFGISLDDDDVAQIVTVAYNYDQFIAPPPATPENDVAWDKLCGIIVNQLGVKRERLHRETKFVKDLGC